MLINISERQQLIACCVITIMSGQLTTKYRIGRYPNISFEVKGSGKNITRFKNIAQITKYGNNSIIKPDESENKISAVV